MDLIVRHNLAMNTTDETKNRYQMAMNALGDMEFKRSRISFDVLSGIIQANQIVRSRIPTSVDWRTKGVVNVVRNQGQIGAVGAFVIADAVGSFHAINTGNLYLLSVDEVAQCCSWDKSMTQVDNDAFDCVHDIGGLCQQGAYDPSQGICNNSSCTEEAKVPHGTKFVKPFGDEDALAAAVAITPVFVYVDASHPSFQFYASGVYDDPQCSSTVLDHAMLLVGYGTTEQGDDYWICKNSWGVSWGMEGYIQIIRNKGNRCGLATNSTYPY
ncbi:procathepsin L-like [Glandiceps talaboti]